MKVKDLLIFLSGSAVGGAVSFFVTKKILGKKLEKKVLEKLNTIYYKKSDEEIPDKYCRKSKDFERSGFDTTGNDTNTGREKGVMSDSDRARVRDKYKNEKGKVEYSHIYKKHANDDKSNVNIDILKDQVEENDDSKDENEDDLAEEINEDYQKNKDRPPRIVSVEKLDELFGYQEETLFYYTYDEVLTTEEGEVIEDIPYYIGDCLDQYGFSDNDEAMIFVQNFAQRTVFSVQKVWAPHGDYD